MSRTKRSHWLHKEELRDGIVRSHIKTKDTRSKQMKKKEDVRTNYMDYTAQELSPFVPDTELSDSSESSTSRVDSHSSDNSCVSSYSDSSSYDSGSSYSSSGCDY